MPFKRSLSALWEMDRRRVKGKPKGKVFAVVQVREDGGLNWGKIERVGRSRQFWMCFEEIQEDLVTNQIRKVAERQKSRITHWGDKTQVRAYISLEKQCMCRVGGKNSGLESSVYSTSICSRLLATS